MNFVAVHSCIILNAIGFEASLFSRRGEGVRAGEIITVCSFNSAESGGKKDILAGTIWKISVGRKECRIRNYSLRSRRRKFQM